MATSISPLVKAVLDRYGLGSLATWVSERMIKNISDEQILLELEERPEFKTAFPEIEGRRARAKQEGISLPALSPDMVINYRAEVRQLFRSWGVPPGFYDSNSDIANFLIGDVSPVELNARLDIASKRVQQAAPEVRAMFDELTGFHGDDALFTVFLDPERAPTVLEDWVQQAEIGGAARRFGFDLSRSRIEEVARYNIDYGEAISGFAELDENAGLFQESISETEDFTVEQEGVSAAFGIGGGAAEKLKQRAGTRVASTSGSGGGIREERGPVSLGGAGRR